MGCGPMAPSSAGAYNRDGQADPPDGNFTAVTARRSAFVWFAGRWHHRLLGQ